MKISVEDFRRQYAAFSDEALLDVDRRDLVELARTCYDEELARRQLKAAAPAPSRDTGALVVAATFPSQQEAGLARKLLLADSIPVELGNGGLAVLVPESLLEDAHQLLDAQVPEEQLVEAAASASYVRHGVGTVRSVLYGNQELLEFVQEVFGAVELDRFPVGPKLSRVEVAIGDSVVVFQVGDAKVGGSTSIYVYVPDVDAAYGRAIELGAADVAHPEDKPYNERVAAVKDPSGNTWWIATCEA